MTYEVVLFRAKTGVSRDELISAFAATQAIIENFDGFIKRTLLEGENGQWIDMVQWQSLAQAQTAAEKVMQMPELAQSFAVIDESTIQMLHLHDVALVTG